MIASANATPVPELLIVFFFHRFCCNFQQESFLIPWSRKDTNYAPFSKVIPQKLCNQTSALLFLKSRQSSNNFSPGSPLVCIVAGGNYYSTWPSRQGVGQHTGAPQRISTLISAWHAALQQPCRGPYWGVADKLAHSRRKRVIISCKFLEKTKLFDDLTKLPLGWL